jgi:hypothetical protein
MQPVATAGYTDICCAIEYVHHVAYKLFDIWTEREERVSKCLWRTHVLLVIKMRLSYTD